MLALWVLNKLLSTHKKVSMRKETSTNFKNEERLMLNCGMAYTLSIIGGRWKPSILCTLLKGKLRYSELLKSLPGISERMLVAQLRELEKHELVARTVFPEVPPHVEYALTGLGKTTGPMLRCMSEWGLMHQEKIDDLSTAQYEAVTQTSVPSKGNKPRK